MTVNKIGVLLKGILIDLCAYNFVHAKTSLHSRSSPCAQFVEPCLLLYAAHILINQH